MSREYKVYLEDILEAIQNVEEFTQNISFEQFSQDKMRFHAVLHNLQNIGEGAKHIPDEIRLKYPSIDWRRIAGLRDIIAHEYFGIKTVTIWTII